MHISFNQKNNNCGADLKTIGTFRAALTTFQFYPLERARPLIHNKRYETRNEIDDIISSRRRESKVKNSFRLLPH